MSLRVHKAGLLDTVQDHGLYGWQHIGINPAGAMDRWSAQIASVLVGNELNSAVLELHFPAGEFIFEKPALIAITGADFLPHVNGVPIPLWQSVLIARHSVLQFKGWKHGARAYLAIGGGLSLEPWLSGYSTNLKCAAGGYKGRALQKGDELPYGGTGSTYSFHTNEDIRLLPWKADWQWNRNDTGTILILPGKEWDSLHAASKTAMQTQDFVINKQSDRMGYRLEANIESNISSELVSVPVGFGTVQRLPNGQLIILMADHQTTGGYPRVAHVVTTSLPTLAQKRPGDSIRFEMTDITTAEQLLLKQRRHLLQLQNACKFRLQQFFHANQY
jgi:antagonist of KipI